LRRELSDSKAAVREREELLRQFSACGDPQRAWLLLEDYFEKLSLSRKDFERGLVTQLLSAQGKGRLEELAFLFLRRATFSANGACAARRPGSVCASEKASQEQLLIKYLRAWIFRRSWHIWIGRGHRCGLFAAEGGSRAAGLATVERRASPDASATGEKVKTA